MQGEITKHTPEEEERIRKAFKDKDWAEIKSSDSWVIFKVMSEFVEGFEKLAKIGPCVTIFGSARTQPEHPYYVTAEEIAYQLVLHGYGVITGGGPGIMGRGTKEQTVRRENRLGSIFFCHTNKRGTSTLIRISLFHLTTSLFAK